MDFSKYLRPRYILTFSGLNYLQAGLSFLVSVFLARELGKEDFGHFSYGMIFANTLNVIMQFGTDRTLVRDLVQIDKPNLTISSAAWLWLAIGTILMLGVGTWAFFFSGLSYQTAIIVLLCSSLGFIRGMSPVPWFDFKGKANYHSLLMLIDRVLFIGGAVVLIFFLKNEQTVLYVCALQLSTRIISLALEWKFVAGSAQLIIKPAYFFIKKIIYNNTWVWFAALGNLLMSQANQLILNRQFGPQELAIFGLSFQIIMFIRLLFAQILRLVTPSIAQVTKQVATKPAIVKKKLLQYCGLNFIIGVAIVLPVYFLTPWLINNFIGVQYLPALPVLNVLYIWSLLFGMAIIINQFLIGLHKQRFFFISLLVFGLISLVLAELFIQEYKAMGAALSMLVSHFCAVVFQLVIVLRTIKKEGNV